MQIFEEQTPVMDIVHCCSVAMVVMMMEEKSIKFKLSMTIEKREQKKEASCVIH
jgi:hypothetical protein